MPLPFLQDVLHKIEVGSGYAKGSTEGALAAVACCGDTEHVIRQCCPRIAYFLSQQAEDPQPSSVPSTADIKIVAVGQ